MASESGQARADPSDFPGALSEPASAAETGSPSSEAESEFRKALTSSAS